MVKKGPNPDPEAGGPEASSRHLRPRNPEPLYQNPYLLHHRGPKPETLNPTEALETKLPEMEPRNPQCCLKPCLLVRVRVETLEDPLKLKEPTSKALELL